MAAETMIVDIKVDLSDDKKKQRAVETVAKITGIESIKVDAAAQKLTVVCGMAADPVKVVTTLRKKCKAYVISMGPPPPIEEPKNPPLDKLAEMTKAACQHYRLPYYNSYPNSMYSNVPAAHLEYK